MGLLLFGLFLLLPVKLLQAVLVWYTDNAPAEVRVFLQSGLSHFAV